jgi:hypothetical protein
MNSLFTKILSPLAVPLVQDMNSWIGRTIPGLSEPPGTSLAFRARYRRIDGRPGRKNVNVILLFSGTTMGWFGIAVALRHGAGPHSLVASLVAALWFFFRRY